MSALKNNPTITSLSCHLCTLAPLCLPFGLKESEVEALETLIDSEKQLKKGETLFENREVFTKIFVLRSGSLKSFTLNPLGDERIIDFFFPGELIGFHAYAAAHYESNAVALETSAICGITFNALTQFSADKPALQKHLLQLISQRMDIHNLVDQTSTAAARLAHFLLRISTRLKQVGLDADEFRLSMTQEEIGNYLGLASATVSRLLTAFRKQGVIEVHKRRIHILDFLALVEINDEGLL